LLVSGFEILCDSRQFNWLNRKKRIKGALLLNFNETYYKAFLSDFDKRHKDIRFFVPFPFF